MSDAQLQVEVTLLGRPYRFACKESERRELLDAVDYLDRKMREIKESGKVIGAERLAVMAALNVTHELLRIKGTLGSGLSSGEVQRRMMVMRQAIDRAMAEQEKLF